MFDTGKVINMNEMFYNNGHTKTIYASTYFAITSLAISVNKRYRIGSNGVSIIGPKRRMEHVFFRRRLYDAGGL